MSCARWRARDAAVDVAAPSRWRRPARAEREVRRAARQLVDLAPRRGAPAGTWSAIHGAELLGRDRLVDLDRVRLLRSHQKLDASWSRNSAKRSRSSALRVGTCALGQPCSDRLVRLGPLVGHERLVHLVGAVGDAHLAPAITYMWASGRSIDQPERPVNLDGPVDHVVQHPGSPELQLRDLDLRLRRPELVPRPRAVQGHEDAGPGCRPTTRRSSPAQIICFLDQQLALGAAADHSLAHHVEGRLALADPPHGVVDAAAVEAFCASTKPSPSAPTRLATGIRQSRKDDLGVPTCRGSCPGYGWPMLNTSRTMSTPGVPLRDDEEVFDAALVRRVLRVGDRHHQDEVGVSTRSTRTILCPLITYSSPSRPAMRR